MAQAAISVTHTLGTLMQQAIATFQEELRERNLYDESTERATESSDDIRSLLYSSCNVVVHQLEGRQPAELHAILDEAATRYPESLHQSLFLWIQAGWPVSYDYNFFAGTTIIDVLYRELQTKFGIAGESSQDSKSSETRPVNSAIIRMSVRELLDGIKDIGERASNTLVRCGCKNVGELLQLSEDNLLAIPTMGPTQVKKIKERLREHGLSLRPNDP